MSGNEIICPQCKQKFIAITRKMKFCSEKCNKKCYYSTHREQRAKYLLQNPEKVAVWNKKRYEKYREKYLTQKKEYYQKNKKHIHLYHLEYRKNKQLTDRAWVIKNNSRRRAGRNIPLSECSLCHSTQSLHRHHSDYNKPLEVTILCRKHHDELHTQIRRTTHNDGQ